MQFISNGPYLPTELLHAHEEGRVVFFCGAGISKSAGLPLFGELIEKIYAELKTDLKNPHAVLENEAFERQDYDGTLRLLEKRYPGGKEKVREVLITILATSQSDSNDSHKAILKLSKTKEEKTRLVTTNYDHLFEYAALANQTQHPIYSAPYLPIPKQSDWNGLVYLHGLLPENKNLEIPRNISLNDLVLTSADFGKAYLTERWAARFIAELFRRYVVCFVGYSLNDPILRYMTEALAADSVDGNSNYQAYAFTDINAETEREKAVTGWKAKGVIPIIYNSQDGHELLTKTLSAWAERYVLGTTGYTQIVSQYANVKPVASTQQDDYIGRMLWALSEPSGEAAKAFANHQPLPTFEWFKELIKPGYFKLKDLPRFQVHSYNPINNHIQKTEQFSLLHRPNTSNTSAWASIIHQSPVTQLDPINSYLVLWLARYLHEPQLLLWATNKGTHPHEDFKRAIERTIDEDREKGNIPKPMLKLWQLYLAGYMDRDLNSLISVHSWLEKLKQNGLSFTLKSEFAYLIKPKLSLSKSYNWALLQKNIEDKSLKQTTSKKIKDFVNPRVELVDGHLRYFLYKLNSEEVCFIQTYLYALQPTIQNTLIETLELMHEVEEFKGYFDRSCFDMPSIEPHWQNRHHHNWTILIELLRDAAIELSTNDKATANKLVVSWFSLPFLSFKRLALYAASKGLVEESIWLGWLLIDKNEILWDSLYKREVCRLLAERSKHLKKSQLNKLENAILKGKPIEASLKEKLTKEQLEYMLAEAMWLRLQKLKESDVQLKCKTVSKLTQIVTKFPEHFKPHEHQKEEFNTWMQGSMDPGGYQRWVSEEIPKEEDKLVKWIKKSCEANSVNAYEDEWEKFCEKHPIRALKALAKAGDEGAWSSNHWSQLLHALSKNKYRAKRSWRYIAGTIESYFPLKGLENIAHSFAWWLDKCAKTFTEDQPIFYLLLNELIKACLDKKEPDSYHENISINQAINHHFGLISQSLFNDIYKFNPKDGDGLNQKQKDILEKLVRNDVPAVANAKFIIGEHAISLFRLDEQWAVKHLIPEFDWEKTNAINYWKGLLLSPRDNKAFLESLKPYFLETANFYQELDEMAAQYINFIIQIQLTTPNYFEPPELSNTFSTLPIQALEDAANYLYLNQSYSENPEKFWLYKVKPFYSEFWPKDTSKITPEISDKMLRLTLATGNSFPDAYKTLNGLFSVSDNNQVDLYIINESNVCKNHPEQALELLGLLIKDQKPHMPNYLTECLNKIQQATPELAKNAVFKRLDR